MVDRYELSERKSFTGGARVALIVQDTEPVVLPDSMRSCTDVVCAVLIALFFCAFVGLMVYGAVEGNYLAAVSIHNVNQVQCNTNADYYCKTVLTQMATSPTSAASATPSACRPAPRPED
jgi:hypothetical protein